MILDTFELEPDDVRSTSMGATGEDVLLSPTARRYVPYQIECKNKSKSAIHSDYNQAKSHGSHEPLVIMKKDHDIPLAVLSAKTFFNLLKELDASRKNHNPE